MVPDIDRRPVALFSLLGFRCRACSCESELGDIGDSICSGLALKYGELVLEGCEMALHGAEFALQGCDSALNSCGLALIGADDSGERGIGCSSTGASKSPG